MQWQDMAQKTEIIAELRASGPRRIFAMLVLVTLATLLFYLALAYPPAHIGWQVFVLVLAGAVLWLVLALYRATLGGLVLTPVDLRDHQGNVLVYVDDIIRIERGTFAFKPSNGFTLKTKTSPGRQWAPGIWWRLGRSFGVGGVTSASQAKTMAEAIAYLLEVSKNSK